MLPTAKSIFITGCSSGIGRATAIHFARLNWQVFATVRNQDDADNLMMTGYTNIHVHLLDVEDETQINQLIRKISPQLKESGLDVLVNNAAVSQSAPLEYAATDHIHQQFSTNVVAPMVLTRNLLPLLRRARGRIINLSAGTSRIPTPLLGVYSATKSALDGMSDALRVELRRAGIRVIVIEPGLVETPIHEKLQKSATELAQKLPTEGAHYYGGAFRKTRQLYQQLLKSAVKPAKVAQTIFKAATSKRPRSRYLVGTDAKTLQWLQPLVPSPVKDQLWSRLLGL